jgi:hypothetical protein
MRPWIWILVLCFLWIEGVHAKPLSAHQRFQSLTHDAIGTRMKGSPRPLNMPTPPVRPRPSDA